MPPLVTEESGPSVPLQPGVQTHACYAEPVVPAWSRATDVSSPWRSSLVRGISGSNKWLKSTGLTYCHGFSMGLALLKSHMHLKNCGAFCLFVAVSCSPAVSLQGNAHGLEGPETLCSLVVCVSSGTSPLPSGRHRYFDSQCRVLWCCQFRVLLSVLLEVLTSFTEWASEVQTESRE